MKNKNITTGYTLVELLIGAGILALLISIVYKVYSSVAYTQEVGHWVAKTTTQIRNGLTLLRNEISRATPPSIITQKGAITDTFPDEYKKLFILNNPLNIEIRPNSGNINQKVIKFFMCQAGKKGGNNSSDPDAIPGINSESCEVMQGLLEVVGNKILYHRSIVSQPTDVVNKTAELSQEICSNLASLSIEVIPTTQINVKSRNLLRITITSRHPKYTNTTVTESIEATFEVDFTTGGI